MNEPKVSRCDLHIHSKYSDRPSEWFLRRIGAPESFVEPLDLYRRSRERGMHFVTISDHNRIEGALDIAHLPGTFISVEATTYFPEDGCKMHILISGISERQFEDIQRARENIYELRDYLVSERIVHSVAHALFRVNNRLSIDQFEKLLVLFKRFETINGARDYHANDTIAAVLRVLTPELLTELATKHNIDPRDDQPWIKFTTGGSDDHGGLFGACAYTETPFAPTEIEYLEHLQSGRHVARGRSGSSLQLGSSLYQIAYSYYAHNFLSKNERHGGVMGALFASMVRHHTPKPHQPRPSLFRGLFQKARRHFMSSSERALLDDLSSIFNGDDGARRSLTVPALMVPENSPEAAIERQFTTICRMSNQLTKIGLERFLTQVHGGYLIESFQALSSLALVGASVTPYLTAFQTQHKDQRFIDEISARFSNSGTKHPPEKKAWVTDTIQETNGVAHTVKTLTALAFKRQRDFTLVTSVESAPSGPLKMRNFVPCGKFRIPEYEEQSVVLPPFLEMLRYFETERFSEIIISTPGPVGVAAKLIARYLGVRTVGIYHTDFPRYAVELTGDDSIANLAWRFMEWFYGDLDRVLVPSRCYESELINHGINASKIHMMPRGVDLERFGPSHRQNDMWNAVGLNGEFKFLYVGRVSREKNLETLFNAYEQLKRGAAKHTALVVVGDGPQLVEFKQKYASGSVVFTGRLEGAALAQAYASCDALVFPSLTDTFGNVILEAHASGLPAIVFNRGGPPEIVSSHDSGIVVDDPAPSKLAEAMHRIQGDRPYYEGLRARALQKAEISSWDAVFEAL